MAVTGGCLCGAVRYEVAGQPLAAFHGHCSCCRRWQGAAFATIAVVPKAAFRVTMGEEVMQQYESSPGTFRCFCHQCGSSLYNLPAILPHINGLLAGTVDGKLGERPAGHTFVGSKAGWLEITD
jgi:hypothetical protein